MPHAKLHQSSRPFQADWGIPNLPHTPSYPRRQIPPFPHPPTPYAETFLTDDSQGAPTIAIQPPCNSTPKPFDLKLQQPHHALCCRFSAGLGQVTVHSFLPSRNQCLTKNRHTTFKMASNAVCPAVWFSLVDRGAATLLNLSMSFDSVVFRSLLVSCNGLCRTTNCSIPNLGPSSWPPSERQHQPQTRVCGSGMPRTFLETISGFSLELIGFHF